MTCFAWFWGLLRRSVDVDEDFQQPISLVEDLQFVFISPLHKVCAGGERAGSETSDLNHGLRATVKLIVLYKLLLVLYILLLVLYIHY